MVALKEISDSLPVKSFSTYPSFFRLQELAKNPFDRSD